MHVQRHLEHATTERRTALDHPGARIFASRDLPSKRPKLVFMDVDGTVYPAAPGEVMAREFLAKAHQTLAPEEWRVFWENFQYLKTWMATKELDWYGDFGSGRLLGAQEAVAYPKRQRIEDEAVLIILAFIRSGLGEEMANQIYNDAKAEYLRTRVLCPGFNDEIYRLMALWADIPKLVVTNSPLMIAETILQLLGIRQGFEKIYFSCKKPHGLEMILREVLERRKVDPEEALYAGDSFGSEIMVARQMGIPAVYISRGANADTVRRLAPEEPPEGPPLIVAPTLNDMYRYVHHRRG